MSLLNCADTARYFLILHVRLVLCPHHLHVVVYCSAKFVPLLWLLAHDLDTCSSLQRESPQTQSPQPTSFWHV